MARHDDPGQARRPQRDQDRKRSDERLADRARPVDDEEEEQLQIPGAEPLKKTQQQQH